MNANHRVVAVVVKGKMLFEKKGLFLKRQVLFIPVAQPHHRNCFRTWKGQESNEQNGSSHKQKSKFVWDPILGGLSILSFSKYYSYI